MEDLLNKESVKRVVKVLNNFDNSLKVEILNSSAGTACLSLDQDDTDQEFIKFDGTSNSDQSSSITTDTSVGSLTGHIRVNINGTDYWVPFYATN